MSRLASSPAPSPASPPSQKVEVRYHDHALEADRLVYCSPFADGDVYLFFVDSDGDSVEAILTPQLAAALRAALALVDLPGVAVAAL